MKKTKCESGLEVVEFIVIMGLTFVVALIIWQFMIFAHTQMVTANAAREAVRAASVCESIDDAVDATRQGHEAEWNYVLGLPCFMAGQPVGVRVRLKLPTVLPQEGDIWQSWGLPELYTSAVGIAVCEELDGFNLTGDQWITIPCLWAGF